MSPLFTHININYNKDKLINVILQCEQQLSTVSCVSRKSYTLHVEYIVLKFGLMIVYIPPHETTIQIWMANIRFKYSANKNNYVDGHKKPAQNFTYELATQYLTMLEMRSHIWVQLPMSTVDRM